MRAAPVDVCDEELARAGRGGGEDADLGEDYLGGGLKVRFAVGCMRQWLVLSFDYMRCGRTLGVLKVAICVWCAL